MVSTADGDLVNAAWSYLLVQADLTVEVRRMVEAAAERPALRRLYPYMGLGTRLKFSARTEYPYSGGYPYIAFVDSREVLDGPAYEVRAGNHAPVARGDLARLLDLVVGLLPEETEAAPHDEGHDDHD